MKRIKHNKQKIISKSNNVKALQLVKNLMYKMKILILFRMK